MSRPGTHHPADVQDQIRGHTALVISSRFPWGAPVAGEEPPLGNEPPILRGSEMPIRLLVVENDVRVRAAIVQTIALEPDLLTVAEAGDATTALALAGSTDPAVALVDVLLPEEVTGLALVRSLKQRPGCAVVAMSARGGLRAAALAAGAVAFVEKESDIDALLNTVRTAASTHSV
jgi:DNA-binding NtrC family response regulator